MMGMLGNNNPLFENLLVKHSKCGSCTTTNTNYNNPTRIDYRKLEERKNAKINSINYIWTIHLLIHVNNTQKLALSLRDYNDERSKRGIKIFGLMIYLCFLIHLLFEIIPTTNMTWEKRLML